MLELRLHIIIEKPLAGVLYGLQLGNGNHYQTVQQQVADDKNLLFNATVLVKRDKNGKATLSGPVVQGKPSERFLYIDIGTSAGQINSEWTRRMKIPLPDPGSFSSEASDLTLQTTVPGIGKDGGPNCATIKPFAGWKLKA